MKTKSAFLFLYLTVCFAGYSQQPVNGGMNTWTNPLHPDAWAGVEAVFNLSSNICTFEDKTDKVEGTSSLKLISDTVPGYPQLGIVAGIFSGSPIPFAGFFGQAFTGRPDTLIFDYKFTVPNGTDTGSYFLRLSQNTNLILQVGNQLAPQANWTHVELPLDSFYTSGVNPDTLKLEFKACGGGSSPKVMGNIMHIDNVRFGYAPPAPAPDVYTMGHDPLGSHNFNFYGAINTHGISAAYSFVYSTDSTFATSITTAVQNISNDSLDVKWATVNGLAANTTYFYYFTGTSAKGTGNGEHMRFYSDTIPFLFENNGADVYRNNYAELNGKVSGFQNPVNLSFEYGTTPAMGMNTASDLPSVSDAGTYNFRGYPGSLTPGVLYFYRIKAATIQDSIYSDIRAFLMDRPYTTLLALPATNVTASSASLIGNIMGFSVPIKINSEIYGPGVNHFHSPLEYHDVTVSFINYSYNATGLQANSHYNTRLKVDTWMGNYYGVDTAFNTLATGIQEEAGTANSIFVYPNPIANYLNIELKDGFITESTFDLFGLNGQLIKELKIPAGQNKMYVSVEDLQAGLYLIKLASDNTVFHQKITVIK